ncbi:thyroid peroxidase-like [Myxocyprinus asiaticus]|uniref:thyroid peroxidase-like n=1 Tax=Myxocyprinus asiaticus TaxID=70543 RepID=UPI0022214EC5|nr:thyroid peroxidase-like [Myxocyprinus asiaticus]
MCGIMLRLTSAMMCCSLILYLCTDSSKTSQRKLFVPDSLIISSFQESLELVNNALNYTLQRMHSQLSPMQMYMLSRQAASETQEISKAAEIFQMTLWLLKDEANMRHKRSLPESELLYMDAAERIANLSGCPQTFQLTTCAMGGKYRSISGVCNNRKNPLWGAANSGLTRWLAAEYEDGENQPKGWNTERRYSGFQLPPVREVSSKIMRGSSMQVLEDNTYSQMLVDWGQYIDHDISFTPQSSSKAAFANGLDCLRSCINANPCFPIQISQNDKLSRGKSCLPFFRSSPACTNSQTHTPHGDSQHTLQRQQMNSATSFIDASTVYGQSALLEKTLRNLSSTDGLLAVNSKYSDKGRSYLPFVPARPSACFQEPGSGSGERVECFAAGDSRVNEILTLSALHTLWVREHNRVATHLKRLNPHWGSEVTYQETRKLIGALHQIITMRDYIPKIIGQDAFEKYVGPYKGYNDSLNPSVSNVFATAAFRFGHATISPVLRRLNESFHEHERFSSLNLHQTFFSPWRLVREGGLDPVMRGLLGQSAALQNQDHLLTEELTDRLVVLNIPESLDLAALNLQRGRDHGLPGYNDWRVFCEFDRAETKSDLMEVVSNAALVDRVMDLYGHPNNIDVWLGGLLERPLPGARTGPLFACLIGRQMKMLREGDRFWWENPGVFSPKQRWELQTHSLSRVICDNSGVTEVPLDPFRVGTYPQDFLYCGNIPSLDLEAWKETPDNDTGYDGC